MIDRHFFSFVLAAALAFTANAESSHTGPKSFLKALGNDTWVIGNDIWNVTQGPTYATKLSYKGKDRVGRAVGHYVGYNGETNLNWTSAAIVDSGSDYINVQFGAAEGDFHWVIHDDLPGAYQYFVNRALPDLGVLRSLWRLDNSSFTNGRTNVKDGVLPPLSEYLNATNVQDETWEKADGTFLTKYDWAAYTREQTYYGVYGEDVGSWYIHPGKDYYNGDHLKGELMIHRESSTGDTVQLNILHGTHYMVTSDDTFAIGKTWGPWLWYLNDGSKEDAAARAEAEFRAWPYPIFNNTPSRGSVHGTLTLSNGRPAAGTAVFLGDSNSNLSTLDQGANYNYAVYADEQGQFSVPHVRAATYGLYAWANGGKLGDVTTQFVMNDIVVTGDQNTVLANLTWTITDPRSRIFQIGNFSRTTNGFKLSGPTPFEHGRITETPGNLTYIVGTNTSADWYFGQVNEGTWTVIFDLESIPANVTGAKLTASLAGFSKGSAANVSVNAVQVGTIGNLANSQDTYRGAKRSGEWRLLEFPVDNSALELGQNTIEINVYQSVLWKGWLWDTLLLEWVY